MLVHRNPDSVRVAPKWAAGRATFPLQANRAPAALSPLDCTWPTTYDRTWTTTYIGDTVQPNPGGTIDPSDIVGRDPIIEGAIERLRSGQNLLLTDPRRMGKTCLLDRLIHLVDHPLTAVKINYEGVVSTEEFLARTAVALRGHDSFGGRVGKRVRAFLDDSAVEVGPLKLAAGFRDRDPVDLLSDMLSRVDGGLEDEESLILALDEVPLAIQSIAAHDSPAEAVRLLQILRRLRSETRHLRWIVTGSIGFHHVLREVGTTTGAINDLSALTLGPLEKDSAAHLAAALMYGIGHDPDDAVVAALVEHSGGIPYLLHQLATMIQQSTGTSPPDVETVARAWSDFVDDRDASRAVLHFLTRIGTDFYRDTAETAAAVLDRIATGGPVTFDELLRAELTGLSRDGALLLADSLVDDHYLAEDATGFHWRYEVLRRIWIRHRRLSP